MLLQNARVPSGEIAPSLIALLPITELLEIYGIFDAFPKVTLNLVLTSSTI